MNGILKNCIVIDLTLFNYQNLGRVLEASNLSDVNLEFLESSKKDGFAKLFFDIESSMVVAFTIKKNREEIILTSDFTDLLHTLKSVSIAKVSEELTTDRFNILLEKISNHGIDSLSTKERNYLDNYSKIKQ